MNSRNTPKTNFLLCISFIALATGCATISKFDQYAYTQTTSIKVDALNVMRHANEKYEMHAADAANVQTAISKMFEYEKNRPKNDITEKMWTVLKDSTGNLYGGFISRWQKEGTLDATFIKEASNLVSESFDQISQLESGKIKPAQVTN